MKLAIKWFSMQCSHFWKQKTNVILHGASNEPESYLKPSQSYERVYLQK